RDRPSTYGAEPRVVHHGHHRIAIDDVGGSSDSGLACRASGSNAGAASGVGGTYMFNEIVRPILATLFIAVFATTGAAQRNWVDQFLDRYKPPKVDSAATVTPQAGDEPWRLMVAKGVLPLSVADNVRVMLASNL